MNKENIFLIKGGNKRRKRRGKFYDNEGEWFNYLLPLNFYDKQCKLSRNFHILSRVEITLLCTKKHLHHVQNYRNERCVHKMMIIVKTYKFLLSFKAFLSMQVMWFEN